jgi:tetratricopeptide (TPR) repeat protein
MGTESDSSRSRRYLGFGVCAALVMLVWLVFGQTRTFPFVNFDDPEYVYEVPELNHGLTGHGFVWAFTHVPAPNWYPLTNLSHMFEFQFYGSNAGLFHLSNVLLHAIVAVLLFLVLRQMTGALWRSAFVAAVFAIHPLRVESVAWITERKDVLSGIFFMLTLGAYLAYVRKPTLIRYAAVLAAFACGLLSKPMLVTTPLMLLLLDYWPLQRAGALRAWWQLAVEKIPLLALSAGSCLATISGQTGKVVAMEPLPLLWRLSNALVSYVTYVWQMIWPLGLGVFYPHPKNLLPPWEVVFAIVALIAVTATAFIARKKHPYIAVGWFWYLLMLFPAIGVVQINLQGHADRYTYLPQIGLYVLAAWGVAEVSITWRWRREVLSFGAALVIGALAFAAWRQTTYWRDSESLWAHTIAVTSNNDFAHASIADLFLRQGRIYESIVHSREALRIRPDNSDAHNNLALALLYRGDMSEALDHWKKSLKIQPDNLNAQCNLAWMLATSGDSSLRNGPTAVELAENVARRAGHANPIVLRTLAAAYAETGRFAEAISTARTALELAITQGNSGLAADLQLNIESYERSLPLRGPSPTAAPPSP